MNDMNPYVILNFPPTACPGDPSTRTRIDLSIDQLNKVQQYIKKIKNSEVCISKETNNFNKTALELTSDLNNPSDETKECAPHSEIISCKYYGEKCIECPEKALCQELQRNKENWLMKR